MHSRRLAIMAVAAILVAVAPKGAAQQGSAEVQLQAAIHKETIEGDLKGAIVALQRIANTPGVSRAVSATALLHLGQCHEKLGNTEAQRSYEQIVKEYGDQAEVVREARQRLARLAAAAALSPADGIQGRLIVGPAYHVRGTISPDGRFVAYCCLVVREVATGQEWNIPADMTGAPRFSPDSETIAYVRHPAGERPELRTVTRTGAHDQVLLSEPGVRDVSVFDWTPDGKQVLVRLERTDKSTEVALVSAMGGALTRLRAPAPSLGGADEGSLSPDGRFFTYRAAPGAGRSTTRVLSLNDGADVLLVDRPANAWNIGWTADGRFAYYSGEAGSEGIWAVRVEEGRARGPAERVAGKLDESIRPVGLTRGGTFVYHKTMVDVRVHVMSSAPASAALGRSRVFSASQSPAWSPDGRLLAYAHAGSGIINIFTPATGTTRSLWTGLPGAIMALTWLPDGSALAVQGVGPDAATSSIGLRRVDLLSGSLSDILLGVGWRQFGANATFSADGRFVTYKTFEAGQVTKLLRQRVETGAQEVLLERKPPQYISAFDVLPATGKIAVAFQETGKGSSLGILDPSARTLTPVYETATGDFIPASICVAWMPDGRSLLFVTAPGRTKGTPMSLWRVPVAGGQPERLFEAETIMQVRVHPDGRQIALDTRGYRMETRAVDGLFTVRTNEALPR